MNILDRNKDYYDYLSHIYGVDEHAGFDRRGSTLLTDQAIREFAAAKAAEYSRYFSFNALLLEAGFTHYMFEMKNAGSVFALAHTFTGEVHFSAHPLCLYFTTHYNMMKPYYQGNWKNRRFSWDALELKAQSVEIKFRDGVRPVCIELPILDKTSLKSKIKAEDLWKNLYSYLCKIREPKIVDTRDDIAKAIDHGFDKRTSFRACKARPCIR